MTMRSTQGWRDAARLAALATTVLLAAACAEIKPLDYTEIHEIPPGPGLLSGDDGAFVLLGD